MSSAVYDFAPTSVYDFADFWRLWQLHAGAVVLLCKAVGGAVPLQAVVHRNPATLESQEGSKNLKLSILFSYYKLSFSF